MNIVKNQVIIIALFIAISANILTPVQGASVVASDLPILLEVQPEISLLEVRPEAPSIVMIESTMRVTTDSPSETISLVKVYTFGGIGSPLATYEVPHLADWSLDFSAFDKGDYTVVVTTNLGVFTLTVRK